MTIVIASGNRHKKDEIARLLPSHTVLLPADRGIEFEYEELGVTFLDNAMGKARHLFRLTGEAVLADDSGLCVPALDGAPGVFSARYGSKDGAAIFSDSDRNAYLLENMKDVSDRRAFFVCSMVLLVNENRFFVAQETVDGEITLSPQGSGGFGYDPLFFFPGLKMTMAQLAPDKKNEISHRGKAARALTGMLEKAAPV
ncbi:MAG: RdgB/HAM1 family non-canonical purine NTP pyrophosphatase [Spirochaetales bacterium]|nr:RdgB/HAM1 family non-canonical purine NTP pyrophosphatase [Spirochaetales bacterium]